MRQMLISRANMVLLALPIVAVATAGIIRVAVLVALASLLLAKFPSARKIAEFVIRDAGLGRAWGLAAAGAIGLAATFYLYGCATSACFTEITSDLNRRGKDSENGVMRNPSNSGSSAPNPAEFNYAPQDDDKNKRLWVEKVPASDSLSANWPYMTAPELSGESSANPGKSPQVDTPTSAQERIIRASYSIRLDRPVFPAAQAALANPPPAANPQPPAATAPAPDIPGVNDPYSGSYLALIEVVEIRTKSESLLCVEVGYQHREKPDNQHPHGRASVRRIEWWKGLAESNVILELKRESRFLPLVDVSFPTTINAFCTYMEERFLAECKLLNTDYSRSPWLNRTDPKRFGTGGVAPLKSMLTHDFEPTIQSTPVLLLLLFSQKIQFVCLAIWMTFFVCLVCRQILFVRIERWRIWNEIRLVRPDDSTLLARCRLARSQKMDMEESMNHGWRTVLEHGSYLDQLLACVSLTGYVGTLYFLAISFPEASNLISSSRAEMISSLSRFTLLMAGAFTTSLWSSVWFQFGSWLKNVQLTAELRQMNREREMLWPPGQAETSQERVDGDRDGLDGNGKRSSERSGGTAGVRHQ